MSQSVILLIGISESCSLLSVSWFGDFESHMILRRFFLNKDIRFCKLTIFNLSAVLTVVNFFFVLIFNFVIHYSLVLDLKCLTVYNACQRLCNSHMRTLGAWQKAWSQSWPDTEWPRWMKQEIRWHSWLSLVSQASKCGLLLPCLPSDGLK